MAWTLRTFHGKHAWVYVILVYTRNYSIRLDFPEPEQDELTHCVEWLNCVGTHIGFSRWDLSEKYLLELKLKYASYIVETKNWDDDVKI